MSSHLQAAAHALKAAGDLDEALQIASRTVSILSWDEVRALCHADGLAYLRASGAPPGTPVRISLATAWRSVRESDPEHVPDFLYTDRPVVLTVGTGSTSHTTSRSVASVLAALWLAGLPKQTESSGRPGSTSFTSSAAAQLGIGESHLKNLVKILLKCQSTTD